MWNIMIRFVIVYFHTCTLKLFTYLSIYYIKIIADIFIKIVLRSLGVQKIALFFTCDSQMVICNLSKIFRIVEKK